MADSVGSGGELDRIYSVGCQKMSKRSLAASRSKSSKNQPLKPIISLDHWKIGKAPAGKVASFLIKTAALETVRRVSTARCPFLWTGLQALQVLCYPPFKWIQIWSPLGILVKGMQTLSQPLLVLSIATAFSDLKNSTEDGSERSQSASDSQVDSESQCESPDNQPTDSMRIADENPEHASSNDWLRHLYKELEEQGITLPERINEEELQRFYTAANGDMASLLSSIKKTIRWRETYRIFSAEELEMWLNMVFWHGLDVNNRPCLIVRLGMACRFLPSHDRPRFVQAIVSQMEYGVLHFLDKENPQITVLVDCQGLSTLKLPMQMMRYCSSLLQDHFPNRLGCLFIIRLPPVVRVIAQTFIQVLKPVTRQKLKIEGEMYQKVLSECFQTLPSYLGGQCGCRSCDNPSISGVRRSLNSDSKTIESVADKITTEDLPLQQLSYQDNVPIDDNCNRVLRSVIIGMLILWALIAFIGGIYDPESRPFLFPLKY